MKAINISENLVLSVVLVHLISVYSLVYYCLTEAVLVAVSKYLL